MRYIDRVLSHIKDNNSKNAIGAEVFDHIDEHQSFFREIGYSDDECIKKSEEKMGDADLVGEQLNEIMERKKKIKVFSALFIPAVIIGVYLLYFHNCWNMGTITGYDMGLHKWLRFDFWSIEHLRGMMYHKVMLLLSFILMGFGIKLKSYSRLTVGYLSSAILILMGPYDLLRALEDIISSRPVFITYYADVQNINMHFCCSDFQLCGIFVLFVLLSIAFVLSLISIKKTKNLKNTIGDVKRLKAFLLSIIIACNCVLVSGVAISIDYYLSKERATEIGVNESFEINRFVTENIELLMTGSRDQAIELLSQNGLLNKIEHRSEEVYYRSNYGCVEVYYNPDDFSGRQIIVDLISDIYDINDGKGCYFCGDENPAAPLRATYTLENGDFVVQAEYIDYSSVAFRSGVHIYNKETKKFELFNMDIIK